MTTPYQLSLAPSLEIYRSEVEYVCHCLEHRYPLKRTTDAARVLHYGPSPPPGVVAIEGLLFPGAVLIDEQGVHRRQAQWHDFGPEQARRDPIGLVFLLLSALEERDPKTTDRYGRARFEDAWLHRHGQYGQTPVDTALAALANALAPGITPFAPAWPLIMPTHDVDRLRGFHRWYMPLREAAGDILKRRSLALACSRLWRYVDGEPWCSMRRLMIYSERYGFRSRFYFMGPSAHAMDSPYGLRDRRLLGQVVAEIRRRGHVVGFHPGFETIENEDLWCEQKRGLETIVGQPVNEGRQHVLRYRADSTPAIWDKQQMALDLTPAFPEQLGFRTGSAHFFPAYCLKTRRTLTLLRGSTAIMEFGLFGGRYRELSVSAALDEAAPVIAAATAVGGHCVLLFHSGHHEPRMWTFYEELLKLVISSFEARTVPVL